MLMMWVFGLLLILLALAGIYYFGKRIPRGKRARSRYVITQLLSQMLLPPLHQRMLQGLLELDNITVNDIMIPRQAVTGIDLEDSIDSIMQVLRTTQHTRLPIYRGDLNQTVGILHMRNVSRLIGRGQISKSELVQFCRSPYYLPERTPLPSQLLEFQKHRRRLGLVVDEYGDVQGIVTLEAILEELVGEFTTRAADRHPDITRESNNSFLIDGAASLRTINRTLGWELPSHGSRTLNGLLLDHLETIPEAPVSLRINNYQIDVLQLRGHLIKSARLSQLNESA